MDILRTLLIGGLLVVSYLLILAWNEDYGQVAPQTPVAIDSGSTLPSTEAAATPQVSGFNEFALPDEQQAPAVPDSRGEGRQQPLIAVTTDLLEVRIDPLGGQIVSSALLGYSVSLQDRSPLMLLSTGAGRVFKAESALLGSTAAGGSRWTDGSLVYNAANRNYRLEEGKDHVEVVLSAAHDGLILEKVFRFARGSYRVGVQYRIRNESQSPWQGYFAAKLVRDRSPDPTQSSGMGAVSFLGAIISTLESPYEKYDFGDMDEGPIVAESSGGWVAFNQHYFLSAWVPQQVPAADQGNRKYQIRQKDGLFLIGYVDPRTDIAPGASATLGSTLYIGPKIIELLEKVHPNLPLTVDFGWLWVIAKPLYLFLEFLHDYVGNWGTAIILLTIAIKGAFFHLSAASYRSMANMRRVAPELTRLRDQYGDDRQRMSQAMMDLYRKEKINPLGGCLPILVQMPVFIALYWVLLESVELRQAPFYGWIEDLSIKDPYFILPLLMGATMFIQMKLNPTPPDPVQARVMQLMPIIFTIFFLWFPAGLVLYWFVNNLLSIAQQWAITRKLEKESLPAAK